MESYDETINRLLDAYGIKSTNEAKQIIKQAGAVASGNLVNDLKIKLIDSSGGVQFQLIAPPYAKYVDYGVKGKNSSKKAPKSPFKYGNKMPPAGAIDRWIVRKNIKGSRNAKGQFIKRKQLSFLIRKSIQYNGTKAVEFTEPYYDNLEYLEKDLAKELGQDTADMLVGYLKDIKFIS
tara:strand:+ start:423 stop:956 length:534 start_codon:yes stop_codon:yes gene_type:complete